MPQQQDGSMSEKKSSQRFHSLNAEQVEVLHQVLSEAVPIHGRGNFPTLELRPRDIIIAVRAKLQRQGITVRDVRLNGSTASHVLVRDNGTSYKDLDIIFGVELPTQEEFQVIKESVLGCLLDCLPPGVNRERISSATMKEAYVQKMVKVFNEHDRWSLISLSNNSGKNLELKFVSALRRQFEFSVDSFQIILDRLLESYMQQDSLHKMNASSLKERAEQHPRKDTPAAINRTASPESNQSSGEEPSSENKSQTSRSLKKDEAREKDAQTELPQAKPPDQIKCSVDEKAKTVAEPEEASERKDEDMFEASAGHSSENKHTSEGAEPLAPDELKHKLEVVDQAKSENSDQTNLCENQKTSGETLGELSDAGEPISQTHQCDSQNQPLGEVEDIDLPSSAKIPQTESLKCEEESHDAERSDKTILSEAFAEDQGSNEADITRHVSCPDTNSSTQAEPRVEDERQVRAETDEEIVGESDEEISKVAEAVAAQDEKHVEDAQSMDCTCSTAPVLPVSSARPADTEDMPENSSTQHTENSEQDRANTLDVAVPPDTEDTLVAPPSLVSDKKTSTCSSGKVSDRLSHMVVLKHSSPKPPRRMCRKVAPSPNPSSGPESDVVGSPFSSSNGCPTTEPTFTPNPAAPSSDSLAVPSTIDSPETNAQMSPEPPNDIVLNHDLSPDAPSEIVSPSHEEAAPESAQESIPSCKTVTCETDPTESLNTAHDESIHSSLSETLSEVKETGLVELVKAPDLLDGIWSSDSPIPDHPSDKDEGGADQTQISNQPQEETPPQDDASTSTIPSNSLPPPVVSLSPPCVSPPPPNLSPPPCLTPPSPMLSTVSPATSFSSPPLSFSPTSSCLSSPPYLTPPMLSLSPPPACLTPPSPCLSPPLLCLTPPVESEELIPQLSPDMDSLILSDEAAEQIKQPPPQLGVPSPEMEEKREKQEILSAVPQAAEPVSFPITIPSSTSHVLPHSPSGILTESDPLDATEPCSPESKESPEMTQEASKLGKASSVTDSVPNVEVLAESMYGDFEAAMDHLRYRLIATRNPEEIRGGGLLKYSNLLVREYRPASETQIKTLERYMCSRFFIDFPDVQEQQRKILSYLKNHFIGEERSKYQYLMTLRRVIDDSTVCLMGHERRQTLNMITVLALKVLGEQNIIPNTDHVTCFYQPAPYLAEHSSPYLAEPSYCSYYIPQGGSTLLYQPYPLHLHPQTGLV